jgi:hypothetical protein
MPIVRAVKTERAAMPEVTKKLTTDWKLDAFAGARCLSACWCALRILSGQAILLPADLMQLLGNVECYTWNDDELRTLAAWRRDQRS